MATTRSRSKGKTNELPIPDFFRTETLPRIADLWMVKYEERIAQARAWREEHGIQNAALDTVKGALVGIDEQVTFITPGAQLVVNGAVEDSQRFCEFLYRNLHRFTRCFMTLDTHTLWQIFHSIFLVNDKGEHPPAGVPIPDADIQGGKWKINPEAAFAVFGSPNKVTELQLYLRHYSRKLAEVGDQYPLIPWPVHSQLGSVSHALVPAIEEAVFFHNVCRGSQHQLEIKGGQPLTEAYSPYGEEVQIDHRGRPIGQKNVKMFERLKGYDFVVIAGQAKSHCVRAFIKDHLEFVLKDDPELAKKVYLVEDLTSPVVIPGIVDFTREANEAFERFRDAGMNVVRSTDPMDTWPGFDKFAA